MAKQATKNDLTTNFDIEINANKGDGLRLTKENNSLHMNPRVTNPNYDPKAKSGGAQYKTLPYNQLFDFAVMNDKGVVTIQTPYLNQGEAIVFYPASFTPND